MKYVCIVLDQHFETVRLIVLSCIEQGSCSTLIFPINYAIQCSEFTEENCKLFVPIGNCMVKSYFKLKQKSTIPVLLISDQQGASAFYVKLQKGNVAKDG